MWLLRPTDRQVLLAIVLLLTFGPGAARAGVVIKFDDLVVSSDPMNPVIGFFDVFVDVTGTPPGVAAYNLQLDVSPAASGLSLSGAIEPPGPAHPALFPGQAPMVFATGDTLQAADNLPPGPDAALMNNTGIVRVNYSIAPATVGVFTLAFDPLFTLLFDGNGDLVTIDSYESGTITVQSGGVVPEPGSLAIWTGLIAAGALYARRRAATRTAARATS